MIWGSPYLPYYPYSLSRFSLSFSVFMELESNDNLGDKLIGKSIGQYIFFLLIMPSGYIIKLLLTNALSVSDFGLLYATINLM